MKSLIKSTIIITLFILSASIHAQWEDGTQCGFAMDSTNFEFIETIGTMENTNLKIGLLMVQFSDWETNINARGGVGWDKSDPFSANIDTFKYRYDLYHNTFFSFRSYYDIDPYNTPLIHSDASSHGTGVWGSFTDYWWEVSHGNLRIEAPQTHFDSSYSATHMYKHRHN